MARKTYQIPDQKSVTYGIPAEEIAILCGVNLRTACRWKSGATAMPAASKMVLARDLGCFAIEWRGWTIRGEELISPEGWTVSRNDVMVVPLMHGQIAALRAKIADLEATHDALEDQPLPDAAIPNIVG